MLQPEDTAGLAKIVRQRRRSTSTKAARSSGVEASTKFRLLSELCILPQRPPLAGFVMTPQVKKECWEGTSKVVEGIQKRFLSGRTKLDFLFMVKRERGGCNTCFNASSF